VEEWALAFQVALEVVSEAAFHMSTYPLVIIEPRTSNNSNNCHVGTCHCTNFEV
jgi:hypothetical protein